MIFPSLNLKRAEIELYYKMPEFGFFVFQFRLSTMYDADLSTLVCYAMSLKHQPMHPYPIFLTKREDYKSFEAPLSLGNLTLFIPDLQKIIGDKENMFEFSALRLTPVRESQDYIAYDISYEFMDAEAEADTTTQKSFSVNPSAAPSDRLNPCPPLRCRTISFQILG